MHGDGAGFAVKLEFRNLSGNEQRFLEHPDCRKLTEAAALVIALAIDPERVRRGSKRSLTGSRAAPLSTWLLDDYPYATTLYVGNVKWD